MRGRLPLSVLLIATAVLFAQFSPAASATFRKCLFRVTIVGVQDQTIEIEGAQFTAWARRPSRRKANNSLNARARNCTAALIYDQNVQHNCRENRGVLSDSSRSGSGITGLFHDLGRNRLLGQIKTEICRRVRSLSSGAQNRRAVIPNFAIQIEKVSGNGSCPAVTMVRPRTLEIYCDSRGEDTMPTSGDWELHLARQGNLQYCDTDSQCGSGNKCVNGLCQEQGFCSRSEDCSGNEICDRSTGQCQVPQCRQGDDCALGFTCLRGTCAINLDSDGDRDGIPDGADNCRERVNPGQFNTDGDREGDACDQDMDDDRLANTQDNCPRAHNPEQRDLDGDGEGDACDRDTDGDGVPNTSDACPFDRGSHFGRKGCPDGSR